MTRSAWLLSLAFGLSACGFHLHGSGEAPPVALKKVYIGGLPSTDTLYAALDTALTVAGASVVSNIQSDAVVLQVNPEETMRSISLNRTGLTREYDLGYVITYEVKTAKGETIEPQQKFKINREQYNDQFLILGKAEEEIQMRQEMREEAAETLVRRLIFLLKDKPELALTAPEPQSPAAEKGEAKK